MDQALADLRYVTTDLSELAHTARLPEPLIRSGLTALPGPDPPLHDGTLARP